MTEEQQNYMVNTRKLTITIAIGEDEKGKPCSHLYSTLWFDSGMSRSDPASYKLPFLNTETMLKLPSIIAREIRSMQYAYTGPKDD